MSNLKTTTDYVLACITHVGALMLMPGSEEMEAALDLEARGLAMVSFKRGIERKNKTRLSWFVEKSENTRQDAIRAYFQENPEVTMVCTEFGHGYAKARYTGWCKLTNTRIDCGESIRKVSITTRDSRSMQLFMSSKNWSALFGFNDVRIRHDDDGIGNTFTDISASRWSRYTIERAAEAVESGHRIEVFTKYGERRTYKLWSNGKWNGRQTSRALLGTLRRSKNAAMIRVTAD